MWKLKCIIKNKRKIFIYSEWKDFLNKKQNIKQTNARNS